MIKKFLFQNSSAKQTIFKNSFWLALAEGTVRILKLVLFIFIARYLGATSYGVFSFALAFVSILVIFSDLGIANITTRELARDRSSEEACSALFSLKIILSFICASIVFTLSFFVTKDPVTQNVIRILGLYVAVNYFNEIIYAVLRAREQMEFEALTKIIQALIVTAVGIIVVYKYPSVINLSYSYLLATTIASMVIIFIFHRRIMPFRLRIDPPLWKKYLQLSWPLAFVAVFTSIYTYIDSVMLGFWGQYQETGWYNAAYKIINALAIPAIIISQSFYPTLSRNYKNNLENLQRIWNYQMSIMIVLTAPLITLGYILAPQIIRTIYSNTYDPAILAFQILIFVTGITYLCSPYTQILIVANQQRKNFYITALGAFVNIILNLFLIPRYSLYGAGVSTLFTYTILLILFVYFTHRFTPIKPFNLLLGKITLLTLIFTTLMIILLVVPPLASLNLYLRIFIALSVYFIPILLYYYFVINRKQAKQLP